MCSKDAIEDNNNINNNKLTDKAETDDKNMAIARCYIFEMKTKTNPPLFQWSSLHSNCNNTFTQVNLLKLKYYFQQELNVQVFTPFIQVQHKINNDSSNNNNDNNDNVCISV